MKAPVQRLLQEDRSAGGLYCIACSRKLFGHVCSAVHGHIDLGRYKSCREWKGCFHQYHFIPGWHSLEIA